MKKTISSILLLVTAASLSAQDVRQFTSNSTFDIGEDTDSPVSLDYYDLAPFKFNGKIGKTTIQYLK
jgi:hypothetical protein